MELLYKAHQLVPNVLFEPSDSFYWSYASKTIFYDRSVVESHSGKVSLLHEIAHAMLNHSSYIYDIELLRIEIAAWQLAQSLGQEYQVSITKEICDEHLETYRDWLYMRSACPACDKTGLQNKYRRYICTHCKAQWSVPRQQLCRVQRRLNKEPAII